VPTSRRRRRQPKRDFKQLDIAALNMIFWSPKVLDVTRAAHDRYGVMRAVVALLAITVLAACNSSSASTTYVPWHCNGSGVASAG
jgi:hypothetical protein